MMKISNEEYDAYADYRDAEEAATLIIWKHRRRLIMREWRGMMTRAKRRGRPPYRPMLDGETTLAIAVCIMAALFATTAFVMKPKLGKAVPVAETATTRTAVRGEYQTNSEAIDYSNIVAVRDWQSSAGCFNNETEVWAIIRRKMIDKGEGLKSWELEQAWAEAGAEWDRASEAGKLCAGSETRPVLNWGAYAPNAGW